MKQSFTHYYVQAKKECRAPEIVYHTKNKKTDEYYYKFMERKRAKALAEAEKKINPEVKFRVVKCTEIYDAEPWF